MNTTFSTVLLATLGIFMFSLCCFAQESGPPTFSVLERDANSLNEVDSDPGMESMLLTPVEDSDVETYASSAGPDNEWKRFQREWRCYILKSKLEYAKDREQKAFSELMKTIADKGSMADLTLALRRLESAFKAVTEALNAWNRSGCGG